MTVKIEGSALSIPESLDSLKITPLVMHRIWLQVDNVDQWYAVMAEARTMFGKNWRGQSRVKRKLTRNWPGVDQSVKVWFDVPDPAFATWVAIKHALIVAGTPNK